MNPPLRASPRSRATARLALLAVCVLASTVNAADAPVQPPAAAGEVIRGSITQKGITIASSPTPAVTADIQKGWNGIAGTETAEAYFSRKRAAARQLSQQNTTCKPELTKALNANNQTEIKQILTRLGFDASELNKAPVQVQFNKPGDASSVIIPTPAGLLTIAMRGNNPKCAGF